MSDYLVKCEKCNADNVITRSTCRNCGALLNKNIEHTNNWQTNNDNTNNNEPTNIKLIISIITFVISIFGGFYAMDLTNNDIIGIISIVGGISAIIFGYACDNLGKQKNKNNCFWWGYFLGIIGLIFVACLPKEKSTSTNKENILNDIKVLQELKDNGAITEEEFEKSKQKILSKL